jgi:capsular polysaccharide biosynthesis protein
LNFDALLRVARRRWWVLLLTVLAVTGISTALSRLEKNTYEATSVMYVPSGAADGTPGNAYEASLLAASYVEVILRDEKLQEVVSAANSIPISQVETQLSARQLGTTALLEIMYTGAASENEAQLAMRAATDYLLEGTAAITKGSVVPLDVEPDAMPSRRYLSSAAWLGVVLGLFFGGGLIVVLERSDRRVSDPTALRRLLGVPSTDLDGAIPATAELVVARWAELRAFVRPMSVACVPESTAGRLTAERAVAKLVELVPTLVARDAEDAGFDTAAVLTATAVPGYDGTAEQLALTLDATILVVARGSREQDVLDASRQLHDLGVTPLWSLVLDRVRR